MATIRKAVIPAAGLGTRQYPATGSLRKEMFQLVDRDGLTKPAIQIAVEEALAAGVQEVCIVTQPGAEELCKRHFRPLSGEMVRRLADKQWAKAESDKLREMGERLAFVPQLEQEGLGHAVWCARHWVGKEPFLVILADHVFVSATAERCAAQLVKEFTGSSLTGLALAGEEALSRYGFARGRLRAGSDRLMEAEGFVEKPDLDTARRLCRVEGLPEGRYLAHFGMHIFTPTIFDILEDAIRSGRRERGEFQLTAAQDVLCQRERYMGLIMQGWHYDIGTPEGLLEAQIALALAGKLRPHAEQALTRILRELRAPSDKICLKY